MLNTSYNKITYLKRSVHVMHIRGKLITLITHCNSKTNLSMQIINMLGECGGWFGASSIRREVNKVSGRCKGNIHGQS